MKSYNTPETAYFQTKEAFAEAIGKDFIRHANKLTKEGDEFLVGLSHGLSPVGVYSYLLEHFSKFKYPEKLCFTFVNSPLRRQRRLEVVTDARTFLKELLRKKLISKRQVFGKELDRKDLEKYTEGINSTINRKLKSLNKSGLDYVILASDPNGRVAGISRKSEAFNSTEVAVLVKDRGEEEFTLTPDFLLNSERIAFLATKSDKRRPLAWLFEKEPKVNESPGFLRKIDRVEKKMIVFIDDHALTWPQIELVRAHKFGESTIRIDLAKPYNEKAVVKRPVVLLIHGFLGLNSYDGLLTAIPSHKYIAAAMHYGSVPQDLPLKQYSKHIVKNIEAVVAYFGERGHPIFLFDHSIANIYFLMISQAYDQLPAFKKFLKGRIGCNPFFGKESKHALTGFLDNVLLPSVKNDLSAKIMFGTFRNIVRFDTKNGVRNRGIRVAKWIIRRETNFQEKTWKNVKERLLFLMSNMDNLPQLNQIPIERALNRLPAKLFAIQIYSALTESKSHEKLKDFSNFEKLNIPLLLIKSEKDPVAKFRPDIYNKEGFTFLDVTNKEAKNLFSEHLYHMVHPYWTAEIIHEFIVETMEA